MGELERWMVEAVQSGSWRQFDDYHVGAGAIPRPRWVLQAFAELEEASALRNVRYPKFALLLGFSYRGTFSEFGSLQALATALDHSPPSLYLFEHGSSLLEQALSDAAKIKLPTFSPERCQAFVRRSSDEDGSAGSLLLLDVG